MTHEHNLLAIDPGANGGAALRIGTSVHLARLDRDTLKILGWLEQYRPVLWIEEQEVRPGNTPDSAFSHGRELGRILGWAEALRLRVNILPLSWPSLYVDGKWSKKHSVTLAENLYPGLQFRGPRGGLLHGLSDAALMLNIADQHEAAI